MLLLNCISGDDEKKKFLTVLFYRLDCWFPNDVGCFCIYFLNYIQLLPGQAIYLGANEPHAYIHGGYISFICFHFYYN
jgi:mannose-6-phosphate isomerase